jgi:cholest-4-en-3-one 26-monooxygenase
VVSSYEQVVALGKCPHALSSDVARGGVAGLGPGDELQTMQDQLGAATGFRDSPETAMLLSMDPPEHTGYRKIVNKGFTPRMISLLEDKVRGLANRYLDGRPAGEPFDLVTELSMPLPITVIAEMLGIPSARHADLARWSNEAVAGTDPEYRNDKAFSELQALVELLQAFDTLKQDRVDSPGDDIASVLLGAVVDGETLTPARFKMFLLLLLIAGNETTRNGISHAVLNLATFPEQWERLRQDPALVPSAVEEVLRVASPVLYFRRNVVADVDVAGQTLAAGDLVSLWYASANRDAAVFDEADRFDVGRTPNPHVAFGGGGPHFCLGASLARLEIRLVLEALLDRFETLELLGPPDRLRSNFLHGIKHLPVAFR